MTILRRLISYHETKQTFFDFIFLQELLSFKGINQTKLKEIKKEEELLRRSFV